MRLRASWMKPKDDPLLEWVCRDGNMTPTAVSREGAVSRVDCSADYAGVRLRELAKRGLVDRIDIGLYGISDDGRGYLTGEVDASQLEEREFDEAFVEQ